MLHERIAQRFQQMLAAGLVEEVEGLFRRGDLHLDLPAMRTVGYRQLWQHLEGQIDRDQAVEKAIAATRQLAKRQLTWLRKWPDLEWIYTDSVGNIVDSTLSDNRGHANISNPSDLLLKFIA